MAVATISRATPSVGLKASAMMGGKSVEGGRFGGGNVRFSNAKLAEFRHLPAGPKTAIAAEKFTVRSSGDATPRRVGLGDKARDTQFHTRKNVLSESKSFSSLPRSRVRNEGFNPLSLPEFSLHKQSKPDTSGLHVSESLSGKKIIKQKETIGKPRAETILADLQANFVPIRKREVTLVPRSVPIIDVPVVIPVEQEKQEKKTVSAPSITTFRSTLEEKEKKKIKVYDLEPIEDDEQVDTYKKKIAKTFTDIRLHFSRLTQVRTKPALQANPIIETKPATMPQLQTQLEVVSVIPELIHPALRTRREVAPLVPKKNEGGTKPPVKAPLPVLFSVDELAAAERVKQILHGVAMAAQYGSNENIVKGNDVVRFVNLDTDAAKSDLVKEGIIKPDGSIPETLKSLQSEYIYIRTAKDTARRIVRRTPPVIRNTPGDSVEKDDIRRVLNEKQYVLAA